MSGVQSDDSYTTGEMGWCKLDTVKQINTHFNISHKHVKNNINIPNITTKYIFTNHSSYH
jgi:hypothetical protein